MEGFPKDDIYDLDESVNLNGKTVMFNCDGIDFTGVVDTYFLNKESSTGSIALKNIATTGLITAPPKKFFVKRDPPAPPKPKRKGGGKTQKRKRKRNKTKRNKTKKN